MESPLGKYVREILKEMCKVVGANYDDIDFKDDNWFLKHSWTQANEDGFKKWLIYYLTNNTPARNEIMQFPTKRKVSVKKTAEAFIWNYGWKTTC